MLKWKILFYEQINLFLENKGQENPRPSYVARVLETMKGIFFCIKDWDLEWIPYCLEAFPSPPFFNYIEPYMVYFKKTRKIQREKIRFTRNSESKKEFFKKHPQVNIFRLRPFLPWSLSFKITNHFLVWLWIDLIEENGQNQA